MAEFFALVHERRGLAAKRVILNQQLQSQLTRLFLDQSAELTSDALEQVSFCGTYNLDEDEVFAIDNYQLPDHITLALRDPQSCAHLSLQTDSVPRIKSIFAVERNGNEEVIHFQSFRSTRIIRPGSWTLLMSGDTFQRMESPAITVDDRMAAVFSGGTLLFKAYVAVNSYLELTSYFRESTDEEVREVIQHALFVADSNDEIVSSSDTWMRKRFAAIRASGVLDRPVDEILERAEGLGVQIGTVQRNGTTKIRFPSDRPQAKIIIRFLAEEIYSGPITQNVFQTNSKRPFES